MVTFLDRYRRGEHKRVWKDLLALGDQVRAEPFAAGAWAVARETMSRARANIEMLVPRLKAIDYNFGRFWDDEGWDWDPLLIVYQPPADDVNQRLAEIEPAYGLLPMSLRAWYEVVGQVSFVGFHPDWPRVLDPLCVLPIDAAAIETWWAYDAPERPCPASVPPAWSDPYFRASIDIGPDACYKSCQSCGPPYAVHLPCPRADAPLLLGDDAKSTFVEYLRESFAWGGFPGLAQCARSRRLLEQVRYLTQDLLPI